MNFSNDPSNAFFLHEYTNNTGWKSIVAKSFLGHEVPPTLVSDEDAILGQHFVRLVMLMTREQRGIFGSFLSCYTKKLLSQDSYQHNVDFSLMASPAKIRSTVFKGATAVLQNLPIPPITLVSDYSYASLNEIVADFMAHGYYYEEIPVIHDSDGEGVTRTLCTSRVVRKVRERALGRHKAEENQLPLVVLFMMEWSDSFEPLVTKQNRASIWIKTITISPPHEKMIGSSHNTYPLSIGPKSSSRIEMERMYCEELRSFKEGEFKQFYDGRNKRMCAVHLELIASIQDQPERRSENNIALGNQTFSSRWGYSIDSKNLVPKIIPCETCKQILLLGKMESEEALTNCAECAAWDFDSHKNRVEVLKGNIPKNYPKSLGSDFITYASTTKISFAYLQGAIKNSHECVTNGTWTKTQAMCYLKTKGLNQAACDSIVENATNCCTLRNIESTSRIEIIAAHNRQKNKNPERYRVWEPPRSWNRGLEMGQHVEAIMHRISQSG